MRGYMLAILCLLFVLICVTTIIIVSRASSPLPFGEVVYYDLKSSAYYAISAGGAREIIRETGLRIVSWSPKLGKFLALRERPENESWMGRLNPQDAYLISSDGRTRTLIKSDIGYEASISPDGSYLAYILLAQPNNHLVPYGQVNILNLDTQENIAISKGWKDNLINWSPDSKKLLFTEYNSSGDTVYWVYDIAKRVLYEHGTDGRHLGWVPDSQWIVFSFYSKTLKIRFDGKSEESWLDYGAEYGYLSTNGKKVAFPSRFNSTAFRFYAVDGTANYLFTDLFQFAEGSYNFRDEELTVLWSPDSTFIVYPDSFCLVLLKVTEGEEKPACVTNGAAVPLFWIDGQ